jgi:3-hydroxybutyryl-CoA dehydrogenase
MGAGIAAILAGGGFATELLEVDQNTAEAGAERVRGVIADRVARGHVTSGDGDTSAARVVARWDAAQVATAPAIVIEAIPERMDLKRDVLTVAESLEPELLATNTSSISIDALAGGLREPQRFLGLHFFNPVPAMALVEVVIGGATSDSARDAALALVQALGKEAIVVRDAPGFASSRLGIALGLEAIRMVEQDVASPEDIDRAMVLGYRHPIGPLRLTDLVGLDVRLDIANTLREAYGDRFAAPPLLERMVAEGRTGKKAGAGFYDWDA